ncbi:MAG: hypothetical protein AAFR75_13085, partial [Pseudomonadota bacterium]
YAVKLTEEGRRALDYAGPLVSRVDERILEAIPSQERKGFLDALLNIVSVLGDVPSSENEKPSRKSAPGRAAPRKAAARKRPAKKAR